MAQVLQLLTTITALAAPTRTPPDPTPTDRQLTAAACRNLLSELDRTGALVAESMLPAWEALDCERVMATGTPGIAIVLAPGRDPRPIDEGAVPCRLLLSQPWLWPSNGTAPSSWEELNCSTRMLAGGEMTRLV